MLCSYNKISLRRENVTEKIIGTENTLTGLKTPTYRGTHNSSTLLFTGQLCFQRANMWLRIDDFVLKHPSELQTRSEIIKTGGFSEGLHQDFGKHPEDTVQYLMADAAVPDWGSGLRRPGDRHVGQAMSEHTSLQIL